MEDASLSSQSAPLDVIDDTSLNASSHINGRCLICHSFDYLHDFYLKSEHSWDAVVHSAQTCLYCDAIVRGCRGWLDEDGKQDWTPKRLLLHFRDDKGYRQFLKPYMNGEVVYRYDDADKETTYLEMDGRRSVEMVFASTSLQIRIFAAGSPPNAKYRSRCGSRFGTLYRTTGFTGSPAALKKATTMLQNCVTNHAACGSIENQRLPTRLLDLRSHGADIVKLVDKAGEYGQYAALSHCWGDISQFTTTRATLLERKQKILLSQLTKTFQEAVEVVRALNIPYLWIDSLCIVQDDHDDWAREASRMSSVYSNALITISATSSRSGDKGLFRRWPEYEISILPRDEEPSSFIFSAEREHFDGQLSAPSGWPEYPLLKRAWALQERLLSPRVLHFAYSELIFECIEEHRCECSGTRDINWTVHIKEPKMFLSSKRSLEQNMAETWMLIIRRHCDLQMTYPGDKLVTLAGIAKRLAEPGDRYLAGIWKNTFVQDLQWRTLDLKPRPKWRAPSWSWASVEGRIFHWGIFKYGNGPTSPEHIPSAQLVDYKITSKSGDEYGELQSGTMQLLAHCSWVTWKQETRKDGHVYPTVIFRDGQERVFMIDTLDDASICDAQATHVETVCVLLFDNPEGRGSLVLRRSESDGEVFERIGLLHEVGKVTIANDPLEDTWSLFPRKKRIVTIV